MTFNKQIINLFKAASFVTMLLALEACGNSTGKTAGKETAEKSDSTHKEHEHQHEEGGEIELTPDQVRGIGIETGTVSVRTLSGTIKVNGTLDVPPQQMLSVSAPMGGFLRSSD